MIKSLTFLGIETSCDETAASVVKETSDGNIQILSNIVSSQFEKHKKYGGVVPELAARSHIENIDIVIKEAIKKSGLNFTELDGVAATAGPGLIVCLTVGFNIGKAIAYSLKKPFLAINHLEGHALSPALENKLKYPFLLLLISGGHSQYLIVKKVGKYKQLGTTIDDALGEAFDKTAKILDLGYPGGPNLEKIANKGDPLKFKLPEPIINRAGCNLSFAGLKSAVLRQSKKISKKRKDRYDLAASFQKTINNILLKKTKIAMSEFKKTENIKNPTFVVAGGVAANKTIRTSLEKLCIKENFNPLFPNIKYCGDNAAMIALTGIKRFRNNLGSDVQITAKSRWPLDPGAPFMKGPGLKL